MKEKNIGRIGFIGRGILFGLGALVFAAAFALVFGWVLMLLWNWLMPALFNLPVITYWQGWGLILICHLLFKGGGHGGPQEHIRSRRDRWGDSCYKPHFNNPGDMDDFRKEFRSRMRNHWRDNRFEGSPEKPMDDNRKDEKD